MHTTLSAATELPVPIATVCSSSYLYCMPRQVHTRTVSLSYSVVTRLSLLLCSSALSEPYHCWPTLLHSSTQLSFAFACTTSGTFKNYSDTQSNEEYRGRIRRQRHLTGGSAREQCTSPLTASQDLGWHANKANNGQKLKIFGKKSCAETMYASELVKSGMYF
jgi:hypothetical protein